MSANPIKPTMATLRIEVNRLQDELIRERDKRTELEEIISLYEEVPNPDVERELSVLAKYRDLVVSLRASLLECQSKARSSLRELRYLRRRVRELEPAT